ncbi:hypothetical protein PIB30_087581 [Stylosanthes scabra]|uniref:Uncharacterized protein n=1 Tax=Stylosanthes scabra TaxID=79078 RepID=A0ABU6QT02_9FABA|nr:hypothetical protein [Stylosanthes scabra]
MLIFLFCVNGENQRKQRTACQIRCCAPPHPEFVLICESQRGVIGVKRSPLRKKWPWPNITRNGTAAISGELKMNPLPWPLLPTMRENRYRTLAQWFWRRELAREHAAGVVAAAAADGVAEEELMGPGKTIVRTADLAAVDGGGGGGGDDQWAWHFRRG